MLRVTKLLDRKTRRRNADSSPLNPCHLCNLWFTSPLLFSVLNPQNLPAEHLECMLGADPLEGGPIRWKEFFFHHSRRAVTR